MRFIFTLAAVLLLLIFCFCTLGHARCTCSTAPAACSPAAPAPCAPATTEPVPKIPLPPACGAVLAACGPAQACQGNASESGGGPLRAGLRAVGHRVLHPLEGVRARVAARRGG